MLIFAKERNLAHLAERVGETLRQIAAINGYVVLAK